MAALAGNTRLTQFFLQRSPGSVDERTALGESPLHIACSNGFPDVVKLLVYYGAKAFFVNNKGKKPWEIKTIVGSQMHDLVLPWIEALSNDQERKAQVGVGVSPP